jgi:predicted enzyme related to lactoylglutathione lyase
MEMSSHAAGTVCWVELSTSDAAAAAAFYGEIFGWSVAPDGTASRGGEPVAAIRAGSPAGFTLYVAVDDVDAAADRARNLGATILSPPAERAGDARVAVLRDPSGAAIGLWQARAHAGSAVLAEPGSLCWSELATDDTARAAALYGALFGWATTTVDLGPVRYTELLLGERPVAGMQRITEDWGPVAPHWLPLFAVDDCDGAAAHAKALGAVVLMPPTELPRMGRFAVLEDPEGASFGVFHLGGPA